MVASYLDQAMEQAEIIEWGAYFSRIVRQFLDFHPYLETQHRAYKQRVLSGQA